MLLVSLFGYLLFSGLPLWPSDSAATVAPAGDARTSVLEEDEIIWLARCIYSESDRPDEQRFVAWVVRNRVETGFRGDTYREVVLEDRQFSAFNEPTPRRARILRLTPDDRHPPWQRALAIAREVHGAPASGRPFPITTRHFYSPISMTGRSVPHWAIDVEPLATDRLAIDPHRFRFFDGIDGEVQEATLGSSLFGGRNASLEPPTARAARPRLRSRAPIARPVPPRSPRVRR